MSRPEKSNEVRPAAKSGHDSHGEGGGMMNLRLGASMLVNRASAVTQNTVRHSTWSSEINRSVDVEGHDGPDTGQEPVENLQRKEPT